MAKSQVLILGAILLFAAQPLHAGARVPGDEPKVAVGVPFQGPISASSAPRAGRTWYFEILSDARPSPVVRIDGLPMLRPTATSLGGSRWRFCVEIPRNTVGRKLKVNTSQGAAAWIIRP